MAEEYTVSTNVKLTIVESDDEKRVEQYQFLRDMMKKQTHCLSYYSSKILAEASLGFHGFNGYEFYTKKLEKENKSLKTKHSQLEKAQKMKDSDNKNEKIKILEQDIEKLEKSIAFTERDIELSSKFSESDIGLVAQNSYSSSKVIRQYINEKYDFNPLPDYVTTIIDTLYNGIGISAKTNAWQPKFINIMHGRERFPFFGKDTPLVLRSKCYELYEEDDEFFIKWKLKQGKEILFKVILSKKQNKKREKFYNEIRTIINGEYKAGDSKLFFKDKKLFLAISTKKPQVSKEFVDGLVMGVDFGIISPAVASFNNLPNHRHFGSKEDFHDVVLQFKNRITALQKKLTYTTGGRGREKKLQALTKFGEKQSRYRDTYNHQISKEIIDYALKNRCGVIHLEDLSSIKKLKEKEDKTKREKKLLDWSYGDLASKVDYKAKKYGIKVEKINPAYTSQMCCVCKEIGFRNENKVKEFTCTNEKCGMFNQIVDADLNASKNIACAPKIDKIKQQ